MIRLTTQEHNQGSWLPQMETNTVLPALPPNKTVAHVSQNAASTWASLSARGVAFIQGVPDAPYTNGSFVPGPTDARNYANTKLGGKVAADWTAAEAYEFGKNYLGVGGVVSGQFQEPSSETAAYAIYPNMGVVWENLWRGLAERLNSLTPQGILIGDYDTKYSYYQTWSPGGVGYSPNSAASRAALASPEAARYQVAWFNDIESRYVHPIIQVYPKRPKRLIIYENWYETQRMELACSNWGLGTLLHCFNFFWPSYESNDDNKVYATRFFWGIPLSNGTLYNQNEGWMSFNVALCIALTGLFNGGGTVMWDGSPRTVEDKNRLRTVADGDLKKVWVSPSNAPIPANTSRPNHPGRPMNIFDVSWMAQKWYGTMTQNAGTNFEYVPFRIGSGSWKAPGANNTTICEAADERRGFAKRAVTGSEYAVVYINPFAPASGESVTVDIGSGKYVTFDAYPCEPVCLYGTHEAGKFYGRTNAIRGIGGTTL